MFSARLLSVFGVVASAVALAVPASADVQSFVADVNQSGVRPWNATTDEQVYAGGVEACNLMRNGMTPQDISRMYYTNAGADVFAVIAQKHICPDTRH